MNEINKNIESRRSFLKKMAYVAPAVVALGTLAAPVSVHASFISVAQVNNAERNRQADIYQENDGSNLVKTVEDDTYVTETLFFRTESTFTRWLNSFFA